MLDPTPENIDYEVCTKAANYCDEEEEVDESTESDEKDELQTETTYCLYFCKLELFYKFLPFNIRPYYENPVYQFFIISIN